MEPKGSLPHSQQSATCPYPEQLTANATDFSANIGACEDIQCIIITLLMEQSPS